MVLADSSLRRFDMPALASGDEASMAKSVPPGSSRPPLLGLDEWSAAAPKESLAAFCGTWRDLAAGRPRPGPPPCVPRPLAVKGCDVIDRPSWRQADFNACAAVGFSPRACARTLSEAGAPPAANCCAAR